MAAVLEYGGETILPDPFFREERETAITSAAIARSTPWQQPIQVENIPQNLIAVQTEGGDNVRNSLTGLNRLRSATQADQNTTI